MILTLYFTKDESTFNPESLRSVLSQVNVKQKVYVVSASPLNLSKYDFELTNIVVPTRKSWPVPIRVAHSFNTALKLSQENIYEYDYLFKVDGDVVLPPDYLAYLTSSKPIVAGFGPALLISTRFFKCALRETYPINYCDDGYILALAIAIGSWPIPYYDPSKIGIPEIRTQTDREYIYGIEYYKWGTPLPLLIILPLTRVYLKMLNKLEKTQKKELKAYIWNITGYIHAVINKENKYWFHKRYSRMRLLHLYHGMLKALKNYRGVQLV